MNIFLIIYYNYGLITANHKYSAAFA